MRLLFLLCLFSCSIAFTQPNSKAWDKSFGGTGAEYPIKIKELPDGGFIMLAWSSSSQSFDKTDSNRDSTGMTGDYWLVRMNSVGQKIWDHTYGGSLEENPTDLLLLSDGGFLLAGYSQSQANGEKSQPRVGGPDFWIVRTDSMGNKIWDKTIGGTGVDQLNAAVQTNDGGFILAGSTLSGIGGDKTSAAIGSFDFWLVKTDSSGNFLWDKTYGGLGSDNAYAITKTTNNGFLLGGYSESNIGFDKSEMSRGQYDFWTIRVNSSGVKVWDKTIGGSGSDFMFAMCNTINGGFLLGGNSSSPVSSDKTAANNGANDYWVVKLNANGSIAWDKSYGGIDDEELNAIVPADSGRYLICGDSYSGIGFEKTEANLGIEQIWILNIDTTGSVNWDKTFFTAGNDEYCSGLFTSDGCYLGYNFSAADSGGYKSDPNYGNGDIWMAKLCISLTSIEEESQKQNWLVYPNPASEYVKIDNIESGTEIKLFDSFGKLISSAIVTSNNFSINLASYAQGLYFLELKNKKGRGVQKIIHD